MGIFYNPPQPPTANNAGTPPEPHVPIGNQGTSVPPRRAAMFAATMAILVAAWPADLEPRLTRPNDQQTKIAPLTLPSGQQPPKFSIAARMAQAVAAWPPDLEPRLGAPNERQQKIAPLTRVYGAQPPPIAPLALAELIPIVASWQETWNAQRAPNSTAWLAPISPYIARTPLPSMIWDAWIPPPPLPARPVQIAPLTLAYGSQPIPQSAPSVIELDQIHRTWIQSWDAQTAPKSAAWNVPPVVQAFVPSSRFRYDILAATQDPVTILLVQSFVVSQSSTDEPPRQFALSLANQAIVQQAWTPSTATPQAPRQTAAWNIPPVISTLVPRTPPPALIWAAWVEPFIRPPAPVAIAPLTPQPVIVAIVPFVASPYVIVRAWQEEPVRLPRLVTIAPLTLTYGSQPPVQAPLSAASRIVLQSWPPDLEPRLGRPNAERVRIAPLTLAYGNPPTPHGPLSSTLLRVLTGAWEPPWHIAGFYLHGNYVPGSFVSLAPVRDTSAMVINTIDYTADLIGQTFTVERLPS